MDLTVINALAHAIRDVEDVALLDRHVDSDHHRTVFTIAGVPEGVMKAAFELVREAVHT